MNSSLPSNNSSHKQNFSARFSLSQWLLTPQNNNNLELSRIIMQIANACNTIAHKISRASLDNLTGYATSNITNYHGEQVKTLDVVSNDLFIKNLQEDPNVCALISEEVDEVIKCNPMGKYIVTFDPLDGSSNIDANVNVGSIFGIFKRVSDEDEELNESDYLRKGSDMLVGGYCLYGASTMLVFALNDKVNGFTLDHCNDEYLLTYPNLQIPNEGKIYSVNEGNYELWNDNTKKMVDDFRSQKFSARYIGSMVADIHRTLLYGGLFMYPGTSNVPNGKLRYLYEVAPMSMIIQVAGGKSLLHGKSALDHIPSNIHERTPIILGSQNMLE